MTRAVLLLLLAAAGPWMSGRAAPAKAVEVVRWQDLRPAAQEPSPPLSALGMALLSDDDPRARAALEQLKASWDTAPVVRSLDGHRILITGYAVPVEGDEIQGLREFLLVPYFGACIHTPPPPPNQVIHVRLGRPMALMPMDAVVVSGALQVEATDTAEGRASYALDAESVLLDPSAAPVIRAMPHARPATVLLTVVLPLALGGLLLWRWMLRERHRTPRELKQAARLRRQRHKARQREAAALARMGWRQRLRHLLYHARPGRY